MVGAMATLLIPGVSITKLGKAGKVKEVVTSLAQKVKKIDYPASVTRLQQSLADMLPYLMAVTPEGMMMMVPNTRKVEFGGGKPPTIHDGPSVAKMEGKIEGTGNAPVPTKPGGGSNPNDFVNPHSEKHMYDPSKPSTSNRSQYGEDVDVGRLRQETMTNSDKAYSNWPNSNNPNTSVHLTLRQEVIECLKTWMTLREVHIFLTFQENKIGW
jgi:hypothetical protein